MIKELNAAIPGKKLSHRDIIYITNIGIIQADPPHIDRRRFAGALPKKRL
jgi:hypothetical protein